MTRRSRHGLILVVLSLMLSGGNLARAQEGTPGGARGLPVTPDPSECTVTAPTVDEVLARVQPLMASPVAVLTELPFSLPEGTPADAATVDAVAALLREVLACLNTGNVLTIANFGTDRFLVSLFSGDDGEGDGGNGGTPEAFPTLPPERYASLTAVHDVVVLPDGRVGALVETVFPDEGPDVQVDYFYFVQQDGQWRLDGVVEDLESRYPPVSGTPTPA